ncbi:unnamed protein product [Adineta steineri]|uniref:G-protein coupled receptors family 1 profile domain-containing protein n=1 Tax=Adineta steineri TaxID=433720 RepID=A0A815HWQ1_9BILA|nr:unnamed protein product [Adineta steineri]CAF1599403.1 unnamed protein product [Adineta steineri]
MKANDSFDDNWLIIPVNSNQKLVRSYYWPALFLLFFSIIGIIGNLLVCLAIGTERRLHNPTNWYIFSLALADMLISGIVIPLATVKEFTGKNNKSILLLTNKKKTKLIDLGFWIFGPILCDFWLFLDVCSCTSSIMHIVVISIDRYLAIEDPLNVRLRQKKYQICFCIIVIWLIAILLSSPMIILGAINPYNIIINGQCLINNQFFVIYGSVVSFVIPLIIVIIMYTLTVQQITNTVNLVAKPFLRQKTAATTSNNQLNISFQSLTIPSIELKRRRFQRQETSFDLSEDSFNNICLDKDKYPSLANDLQNDKSSIHSDYTCPRNSNCLEDDETTNLHLTSSHQARPMSLSVPMISHHPSLTSINQVKRHKDRLVLIPSLGTTRSKSSAVRNEQKAVKVLGVVFVIFVIAWFPFCIMNILRGVCKHCSINENLLNSFVWLGYVSASINPVVYTMFNRNFRLKFIALLKCHCLYSRDQQKRLLYYQSHSSLHGSRILRKNGLVQNDIRRFNAHR